MLTTWFSRPTCQSDFQTLLDAVSAWGSGVDLSSVSGPPCPQPGSLVRGGTHQVAASRWEARRCQPFHVLKLRRRAFARTVFDIACPTFIVVSFRASTNPGYLRCPASLGEQTFPPHSHSIAPRGQIAAQMGWPSGSPSAGWLAEIGWCDAEGIGVGNLRSLLASSMRWSLPLCFPPQSSTWLLLSTAPVVGSTPTICIR